MVSGGRFALRVPCLTTVGLSRNSRALRRGFRRRDRSGLDNFADLRLLGLQGKRASFLEVVKKSHSGGSGGEGERLWGVKIQTNAKMKYGQRKMQSKTMVTGFIVYTKHKNNGDKKINKE